MVLHNTKVFNTYYFSFHKSQNLKYYYPLNKISAILLTVIVILDRFKNPLQKISGEEMQSAERKCTPVSTKQIALAVAFSMRSIIKNQESFH